MSREEILEVEIGEIQERLENIPNDTPEDEVNWLKEELQELSMELNGLYLEGCC